MGKNAVFAVVLVFCLSFCARGAFAEEKIASVDLGKLFDSYEKTKDFDKSLETKVSAYEKERNTKFDEIKKMQDNLSILADKEKEKKQKEIEGKMTEARNFALSKEGELKKERDDKAKEIIKDIETAVSDYSQKSGYTVVIDERVLVYKNSALDITDQVLDALQAPYKKK